MFSWLPAVRTAAFENKAMKIKKFLIRLHWFASDQLGLDLLKFVRAVRGTPQYLADFMQFRRGFSGTMSLLPCLGDRYAEGGSTKNEYFWQDLWVAREIFSQAPVRHVDIGSRIDGFVAHVAAYREIEVFDIRPVTTEIPGVVFKQADLTSSASLASYTPSGVGYCDSLSCLHALEHFGLGRYGDPIDPKGYERGIANMARLVQPSGLFYLSTPIGQHRVEFNANWVFDPLIVVQHARAQSLELLRLVIVTPEGVQESAVDDESLRVLGRLDYRLGIFTFKKLVA